MAEKLLQLLDRHTAHDRPGRERVAQGVEVDVVELGDLDGVVVSRLNVAGLEDSACGLRSKADQRAVRVVVHRDFAAPAALRHLKADDTAAQVDALPCQSEQLAAT
jgi:hypothetical protein